MKWKRSVAVTGMASVLVFCLGWSFPKYTLAAQGQVKVQYFFSSPCESCREGEKFLAFFEKTLADMENGPDLSVFSLQIENCFQSDTSYNTICNELDIPASERFFPMLVIGEHYIQGQMAIEEQLAGFVLQALEDTDRGGSKNSLRESESNVSEKTAMADAVPRDESEKPLYGEFFDPEDSHFIYFYTASCADCGKTLDFFDSLTAEYIEKNVSIMYKYILDPQTFEEWAAYVEAYDLPEEKQSVPIVFFSSGYLHGYQAIRDGLQDVIEEGKATHFVPPNELSVPAQETMDLRNIAVVFFLTGLTPCFVFMLLFLFGVLAAVQRYNS